MKASLMLRLERSTIARHIRRLASSADYLERIIRPYMYENMMWYTLPIVDALGSAVIERSASTALTKEKESPLNLASFLIPIGWRCCIHGRIMKMRFGWVRKY